MTGDSGFYETNSTGSSRPDSGYTHSPQARPAGKPFSFGDFHAQDGGNGNSNTEELQAIHRRYRIFLLFSATVRHLTGTEFITENIVEQVTDSQADALRFLLLNEHMSMGDIAYGLGYTISGATKAINRLEQKGWVTRHTRWDDQREVEVALTQRGRELAMQIMMATSRRVDDLFERTPKDLVERLESVLEEFIAQFIVDKKIAKNFCVACGFEGGIECSNHNDNCVVAKTTRNLLGHNGRDR